MTMGFPKINFKSSKAEKSLISSTAMQWLENCLKTQDSKPVLCDQCFFEELDEEDQQVNGLSHLQAHEGVTRLGLEALLLTLEHPVLNTSCLG